MKTQITIDCAGDKEIVLELKNYLENLGINSKSEEYLVDVSKQDVEKTLNLFLKETGRTNYKIRKIDCGNFLLSKEVSLEDLDLLSCEICGYALSNEYELMNHRRTDGLV
jgi:hypothetical protein